MPSPGGGTLGHIGRYTIVRKIGEGGMGAVYEAEQDRPKRTVALKIIRVGLSGEAIARDTLRRFEQEAQALARLQHPGIAQVYDAGLAPWELPGRGGGPGTAMPYFAMEYVQGKPLLQHAQSASAGMDGGPRGLSVKERLELLARVCDAVQHAHQKGVIHRDIKPGNVLVVDESDEGSDAGAIAPRGGSRHGASALWRVGQPKVLDFGVARFTDADRQATISRTDVGQLVGTLPYMSPEQVTGDPDDVDTRSDVYALGVLMYELLAGVLPYEVSRKALHEAVRVIREEEPTRLSRVDRGLRGDIETIGLKALEKDKARRYQTASELAADIRRFLNDEPIEARPASAAYQFAKFAKRNRVWVGAGGLAVVALTAAFVASAGFAVREARARVVADESAQRAVEVTRFVQDMLSAANPQQAQGREVSVMQAVDAAAARLDEGQLKGQPQVELGVRGALARTYLGLGITEKVWPQLNAMDALVAKMEAKAAEERGIFSGLWGLAGVKGAGEISAKDKSELTELRGTTLQYDGKLTEAEAVFRQALEIRQKMFGPSSKEVGPALNNLGVAIAMQGRLADAEPLVRSAYMIARRDPGPDSKESMDAMMNLATIVEGMARYDEAESLNKEAMERRIRVFGEKHPDTLIALGNYAVGLSKRGKNEEALPLYRKALELSREVMGPDHADTMTSMANLSGLLDDLGKASEAEEWQRKALEARTRVLGESHPDTLDSMNNLAQILVRKGDWSGAEALLKDAVRIGKASHALDQSEVLMSACYLGGVLIEGGKLDEAEPLLADAVVRGESVFPESSSKMGRLRYEYGHCLMKRGKFAESEPQFLKAEAAYVAARGETHESVQKAREQLVTVYEQLKRPAEVAMWKAKLAASFSATGGAKKD